MESVVPRPGKVEIGFTDDRLTGTGGAAFVAEAARRLGLLPRLGSTKLVAEQSIAGWSRTASKRWNLANADS